MFNTAALLMRAVVTINFRCLLSSASLKHVDEEIYEGERNNDSKAYNHIFSPA